MKHTFHILFAVIAIGLVSCSTSTKNAPDSYEGSNPSEPDSEKETLTTDSTKNTHTDPPPINTVHIMDKTKVFKTLGNEKKNDKMIK